MQNRIQQSLSLANISLASKLTAFTNYLFNFKKTFFQELHYSALDEHKSVFLLQDFHQISEKDGRHHNLREQ